MNLKIKGLFLLGGILVSLLWAGTTGKITGRVTDATTGDGLPFAVVKIKGTQMGAFTDDQGYYVILNVPPGAYDIEVTYTGYQPGIVQGVVVEADRTVEINIALKPTTVEVEPIVVEAKEKLIKPDVPESRQTLRAEEVQTIPVTTIQQTVTLSAGVVQRGGLHIRGGRPDEVVYVVNGVEVRDPYTNYTTAGAPLIALEEASVLRGGFDVDQGITASGAIQIVTRSGSDKYSVEYRASTNNMRFLSEPVYRFFNSEKGDYYQDVILGFNPDVNYIGKNRYSDDEIFHEFSISGPLIPTKRDWANFFIGGEYRTDRGGRFPISMDRKYRNLNEAITYRINIPFTKYFLFFISGFYRNEKWRNWHPNWRLALDNYFRFKQKQFQISGGINWLIANKYMNEFRFGYYDREWKRNAPEDVDFDGVDDFDDRDADGFVEIDLDYFRVVYYDTIQQKWIVDNNFTGLDSLSKRYGVDKKYFKINKEEGYVELPFFWWEEPVANMYPASSTGPYWWPSDSTYTAPYNTFGWGERTRQDIEVVEIVWYEEGYPNVDTLVKIGDTYYEYPYRATFDYLLNAKVTPPENFQVTKVLASLGNQYLPYPWVYPRSQWGTGRSKLMTFSWRLVSQLVKKTKTTAGHELLAGIEYKRMDIMRYTVDFAGGLSNVYFDFVNPPFERREWDTVYSFVDWMKDHPVKPWQFAFYIRDKIEMEGMVAKVGIRFDYYDPSGYYFTDSTSPFVQDTLFLQNGIKYLNQAKKAEPKWYFSPRIGISHPITERDVLHFTYGHFFQIPPYYQMITSYAFSGAFPIVGNPTLDPERTIAYELGIKHGFTEDFIMDITAFYKDIYSWARSKMFVGTGYSYTTFVNEDYGFARGVEISFIKRTGGAFLPYLGINANYTYQIAKGSFSSPYSGYLWQWSRYPSPPRESPLDWDIRHNLNLVISWIVPKGDKKFIIDDWGLTINYRYSSGSPWTPTFRSPRDAMEKINAERLPPTKTADLRLYKNITLMKNVSLQLFMDIYNIFNERNLNDIANVEWYEQFGNPEGEDGTLSVWGQRRTTRIGFFLKVAGF